MHPTTTPCGAATHKTFADVELDEKIADRIRMIESALAARDDALKAVTKCEKSALISAWRLGQFLTEKNAASGTASGFRGSRLPPLANDKLGGICGSLKSDSSPIWTFRSPRQ